MSYAIDAYTKLLINFNGTDGATSYIAETGQTVTFKGHAQLDTAQKNSGASSLLLDGTDDYVTVPDHADWDFGADPFTIDLVARFANVGADCGLFEQYGGSLGYWRLYWDHTDGLIFWTLDHDVWVARYADAIPWSPSIDTWYHIALQRNGTAIAIYVNGTARTLTAATPVTTNVMPDIPAVLELGTAYSHTTLMNGWIDSFRISKGIARYGANFTPGSHSSFLPLL